MALDKNDLAQQYAHRRARNLAYFQKAHPSLYQRFSQYRMNRVEVAVSPAERDIDVLSEGVSLYAGKAAAACRSEVDEFLAQYQSQGVIRSLNPPWPDTFNGSGFSEKALKSLVEVSPLKPADFHGFPLTKLFFPQLVFLGCGAGFHIQQLLEKVQAVNAIIFEPDPELFAASLFCVDWETVGAKFNASRGESLVFLIGGDEPMTEEQQKSVLQAHLYPTAPMYPYMSVFVNHRKQQALARVMKDFGLGIHKFRTSWLDYDDTLRRARNCFHNLRQSPWILNSQPLDTGFRNVVIVGSGPSIDHRFAELKARRDDYVLVSAGTGIKGLLENDLIPDFHVELDPDYLVYGYLSLLERERLQNTVLIAVNEVNPLVPPMFGESFLFFKQENPTTLFFSQGKNSFEFCNPTVTNAALSVFTALGARQVFLFGCDLGYQDFEHHHSSASIYAAGESEVSIHLKKRADVRSKQRTSFKVAGVNGTEVYTRGDFFVAKQEMEVLIDRCAGGASPSFYNCSDGADIRGTEWLDNEGFASAVGAADGSAQPMPSLSAHARRFPAQDLPSLEQALVEGVAEHMRRMHEGIDAFRIEGSRDLNRAVLGLAKRNMTVALRTGQKGAAPDQVYGQYLVGGAIKSFLMVGLSHGMALKDRKQQKAFLKRWAEGFKDFLDQIPDHCRAVLMSSEPPENDPWVTNTMKWVQPEEVVPTEQPGLG